MAQKLPERIRASAADLLCVFFPLHKKKNHTSIRLFVFPSGASADLLPLLIHTETPVLFQTIDAAAHAFPA